MDDAACTTKTKETPTTQPTTNTKEPPKAHNQTDNNTESARDPLHHCYLNLMKCRHQHNHSEDSFAPLPGNPQTQQPTSKNLPARKKHNNLTSPCLTQTNCSSNAQTAAAWMIMRTWTPPPTSLSTGDIATSPVTPTAGDTARLNERLGRTPRPLLMANAAALDDSGRLCANAAAHGR